MSKVIKWDLCLNSLVVWKVCTQGCTISAWFLSATYSSSREFKGNKQACWQAERLNANGETRDRPGSYSTDPAPCKSPRVCGAEHGSRGCLGPSCAKLSRWKPSGALGRGLRSVSPAGCGGWCWGCVYLTEPRCHFSFVSVVTLEPVIFFTVLSPRFVLVLMISLELCVCSVTWVIFPLILLLRMGLSSSTPHILFLGRKVESCSMKVAFSNERHLQAREGNKS